MIEQIVENAAQQAARWIFEPHCPAAATQVHEKVHLTSIGATHAQYK
jgi:hypothetical protein